MSKADWGRCTWATGHHFAMAYPCKPTLEDQQWMYSFIVSLCHNLPCSECKGHCAEYVTNNPPNLLSSCALQTWWFNFHNEVNKRLGKPIFTKEQYQKKYGTAVKIHRDNRLKEK